MSRCPICSAPTAPAVRPFCSRRCADVDLNRWLTGSYAVPALDTGDDEEASLGDHRDGPDRGEQR